MNTVCANNTELQLLSNCKVRCYVHNMLSLAELSLAWLNQITLRAVLEAWTMSLISPLSEDEKRLIELSLTFYATICGVSWSNIMIAQLK